MDDGRQESVGYVCEVGIDWGRYEEVCYEKESPRQKLNFNVSRRRTHGYL
jgi:hypothetical protein